MPGPRIVILGAGSFFFGRAVIWNMLTNPILQGGTLALVDTDRSVLATMERLARRAAAHAGVPTTILASVDRCEVLPGADFVVPTFSDRNARFRGLDCAISARHGVRMCSGDTIGPGGIFRALREVPTLLSMARDVERLCPHAWMINFVNPSTVLGIALDRFAPGIRSISLCDGPHEPHCSLRILKAAGILPAAATAIPPAVAARLDLALTGVNHFSWIVRLRYDGRDYLPQLADSLAVASRAERATARAQAHALDVHQNADAKARYNASYALALAERFGAIPDCIAHTKEYMPFWQGWGVAECEPAPLAIFDAEARQRAMDEHRRVTEDYAEGRRPIAQFFAEGRSDHATDIIAAMWGGLGQTFRVNTTNRGAVPNMPADAYLELSCHLDMQRCQPLLVGELPIGVRGLCQRILDCHEVTAVAAARCDRALLARACALDPIMLNLTDSDGLVEELLAAERDALPAAWFPSAPSALPARAAPGALAAAAP